MVAITDTIVIPEHELKFMASRSSGSGGQNTNKVNILLNRQFFEKRMKVMSKTTLEMTKELVIAQIEAKALSPDEVQTILRQTHAVLMDLQDQEARHEAVPESVAWKKSVTRHTITCLECGMPFKQLSGRHLKRHGLNARSYRAKYDIPWTQPLAAKDTTTRRKQLVQRIRPWEKAPQFVKAHQRKNRKATETPKRARTKRAEMAHA